MNPMIEAMNRRRSGGFAIKIIVEPPGAKSKEQLDEEAKGSDLAPVPALAVDLAGRRLAGTAPGLMTFPGYLYAAAQAWFFGWLSLAVPGGWTWVFLTMAATRLLSAAAISRVGA